MGDTLSATWTTSLVSPAQSTQLNNGGKDSSSSTLFLHSFSKVLTPAIMDLKKVFETTSAMLES